ncbi:HAD-IIA family hydrolase [Nakamurella deserti]|uniref:HAD-IIA family hydrolase n=1 Tax=Nakamurella deserti TaxID=2164074 RepID=UPI000DBE6B11|nr:HAD-IIA family hydrolase [Nakamurella deserti]
MTSLAERFDVLLLDLDGTVYLGHQPIDHVGEALQEAARRGARSVYVTNNASRPPAEVAAQLSGMGLDAAADDVLTSPQAAVTMLVDRHPTGAAVLVVGAPYLADEVARRGLTPVRTFAENPVAVVQGHSPETGWPILAEACLALRGGADWVAANVDATLPTDRGLLPGNGAMVSVLVTATGRRPRVAGKPARPMIDAAIARYGSTTPLVVGDRLDTDIEAAVTAGVPSLLVFTGVSTPAEVVTAAAERRPTHVGFDMRAVVDAARSVEIASGGNGWQADFGDGGLTLRRDGSGDDGDTLPDTDALHALAALARAGWAATETPVGAVHAGDEAAGATLQRLGIRAG